MMDDMLQVRDLSVAFSRAGQVAHAVNYVSYTVRRGETLGIVGESGSGKSVHALAMLGLVPSPPSRVTAGEVLFDGRDLLTLSPAELRGVRGGQIGFVSRIR